LKRDLRINISGNFKCVPEMLIPQWGGVSEPSETPVFIGFREIVHPFCIQFRGNLESS